MKLNPHDVTAFIDLVFQGACSLQWIYLKISLHQGHAKMVNCLILEAGEEAFMAY